ncbi:MAG: MBL fold metallo-hydrolase [Bryobacteraceae bacterium]
MKFDSSQLSSALTVHFWGVRGSIPTPGPETVGYGGNTSCVELRCGDERLILDAGSGIRPLGLALSREFAQRPLATTLLLSHTHWDHIQGLPFFRPAYNRANQVRILGAPGTRAKIHTALSAQMDPIEFPVPLQSLSGIATVDEFASAATTMGKFAIRMIGLNHPGGCTGFRITAGERTVAYLPDHEPYRLAIDSGAPAAAARALQAEGELLDFLGGCDLLILDSQYDRIDYPSHIGWGHGCLDDSVALALRASVGHLVLFHHDPEHDDRKIDAMLAQARQQVFEAGARLHITAARELEQIAPHAREKLAA